MSAAPPLAPFPWERAIGFGLGVLKLSPEAFWQMTPRELAFAIRAITRGGDELLTRTTFTELLKRFPDDRHQQ